MQKDYAQKILMDQENGCLRRQLFDKQKKQKKTMAAYARHMMSEECLEALAQDEWKSKMKEVFKSDKFKALQRQSDKDYKVEVEERKKRQKETENVRKEIEKERVQLGKGRNTAGKSGGKKAKAG